MAEPPTNLIALPTPTSVADPDVVALLEALLARAKAGQLTSLAITFDQPGSMSAQAWRGVATGVQCRDLVVGLDVLHADLVDQLRTRFRTL